MISHFNTRWKGRVRMSTKAAERRKLHGTGKEYWRRLGADISRDIQVPTCYHRHYIYCYRALTS